MTVYQQIMDRQQNWAKIRGIDLIGSAGEKGAKNYTPTLDENLFEPLSEQAQRFFSQGSGNEIVSTLDHTAKMQALHSSSALGVNVFHYWKRLAQFSPIASACKFCGADNCQSEEIEFEVHHPIPHIQRIPPNIDILFKNNEKSPFLCYAIESKFTEPFSSYMHPGLNPTYLEFPDLWEPFPHMHELAKMIRTNDNLHVHLHAAQLIKHILGLQAKFGKDQFKLLYLWYDVESDESNKHRQEIEKFSEIAKDDGVSFLSLTYQEMFLNLFEHASPEHRQYLDYLKARYF